MGMYSEFHPNRTVIQHLEADRWHPVLGCEAAVYRAERWPSEAHLRQVLDCAGVPVVRALRPRFEARTRQLAQVEVARVHR